MTDLKTVLRDYGADYEDVMTRFVGNEQLYQRLLAMLPRDENLQKLGRALQAGDYAAAFDAAHTLKGVAGNLGLAPLEQAACSIVESLRSGNCREDPSALFRAVEKEFERAGGLLDLLKGGT